MANTVAEQLHRNAVAPASLAVAVSSLGYNTWCNEATENNRNLRAAAFEILLRLGELRRLAFPVHYDRDLEMASRVSLGPVC